MCLRKKRASGVEGRERGRGCGVESERQVRVGSRDCNMESQGQELRLDSKKRCQGEGVSGRGEAGPCGKC